MNTWSVPDHQLLAFVRRIYAGMTSYTEYILVLAEYEGILVPERMNMMQHVTTSTSTRKKKEKKYEQYQVYR